MTKDKGPLPRYLNLLMLYPDNSENATQMMVVAHDTIRLFFNQVKSGRAEKMLT
jgi:hypothetical protein